MMPNAESDELQAYISDLTALTNAGKINWRSVNPTTFVWDAGAPRNARVSLQRLDRLVALPPMPGRPPSQRKETSYLFQVFDLNIPNAPILNVESSSDAQLNDKLTHLFEFAKTGVTQRTLEFLRSILPSDK
jgi:hypothetical protein